MKTPSLLLTAMLAAGPIAAQEPSEPAGRRQAGAADLDAWNRESFGVEGTPDDVAMRPRKSDQTRFLYGKQKAFYERSLAYLRGLGCRQAIAGSNWRGHSYSTRHVLELDSRMGYVPPEHRAAVLEAGTAPILTEPIRGRLSLSIEDPGAASAFKLNDVGDRVGKIEAVVVDGRLILDLPGHHRSRFIEVAR